MYTKNQAVRIRLCEILIARGLISPETLERALLIQKEEGGRIGEILVRMKVVSEADIAAALAEQLGILCLSAEDLKAGTDAAQLVPEYFAVRAQALPICLDGGVLTVAMADPLDFKTVEDLERITWRKINPAAAPALILKEAIKESYKECNKRMEARVVVPSERYAAWAAAEPSQAAAGTVIQEAQEPSRQPEPADDLRIRDLTVRLEEAQRTIADLESYRAQLEKEAGEKQDALLKAREYSDRVETLLKQKDAESDLLLEKLDALERASQNETGRAETRPPVSAALPRWAFLCLLVSVICLAGVLVLAIG